MSVNKVANQPANTPPIKVAHTSRFDVPFQALHSYLHRHHDARAWTLEERENSIGVYLTGSKGLVDTVHAYEQAWKDCSEYLFREAPVDEVIAPLGGPRLRGTANLIAKETKE